MYLPYRTVRIFAFLDSGRGRNALFEISHESDQFFPRQLNGEGHEHTGGPPIWAFPQSTRTRLAMATFSRIHRGDSNSYPPESLQASLLGSLQYRLDTAQGLGLVEKYHLLWR